MLASAVTLIRRGGVSSLTVERMLAESGAPRGSVYHHFPAGRGQLVGEAIERAGVTITAMIRDVSGESPVVALDIFVAYLRNDLCENAFSVGCPVVGAAVGGAADDPGMRDTVDAIFKAWIATLVEGLQSSGIEPSRATSLAWTVVAALEGALILCRSHLSLTPLDCVASEIRRLVVDAIPAQV